MQSVPRNKTNRNNESRKKSKATQSKICSQSLSGPLRTGSNDFREKFCVTLQYTIFTSVHAMNFSHSLFERQLFSLPNLQE